MVKTEKAKHTLKIVGNIVFWVVLALVVVYSLVALLSDQDSNKITIFGVDTLSVQSDSMKPTFKKGDLIFINTNFEVGELEVGDVITYIMTVDDGSGNTVQIYNSHRITEIDVEGTVTWFTTQGDNNATPDPQRVVSNDILGVWTGGRLAGIGSFVNFLKSSLGFFMFIVLPCFIFLVFEIIRFVKIISEYNVQKALGDRMKLQEEAVALAKAQLEAEMKAKQEAEKKPD